MNFKNILRERSQTKKYNLSEALENVNLICSEIKQITGCLRLWLGGNWLGRKHGNILEWWKDSKSWVVVSWVEIFDWTQIIQLKWVYLNIYKLYLDRVIFLKASYERVFTAWFFFGFRHIEISTL